MPDKNIYVISTEALFKALNDKRKKHELPEIENFLVASKLGILFALKTNGLVNFRGEHVELNDSQLVVLQDILEQHFNAEMISEIRELVLAQELLQKGIAANPRPSSSPEGIGFLNKLKGFLKVKATVQGSPA
jgi:hypothetical protein